VLRRKTLEKGGQPGKRKPGREDLKGLLRRPMVQLTLVATVAVQMVAVSMGGERGVLQALELSPVVVEGPTQSELATLWQERALEREADRLLSEHRQRGYRVTPQLARQITAAAAKFEIEPNIAFGLVRAESSFRNQATSPVGAVGLTQLMPRTAAWMRPGVTRAQLRDPETNLSIGFEYLRYLIDKYEGDEKLALIAYNRGPGTVDRALRQGRNPDNGYADFVYGNPNHGHRLFTR
jgi:hypothetical protein